MRRIGLLVLLVLAPAAYAAEVRKPATGTTYSGSPGKVTLMVGAGTLEVVAFTVRCGDDTATTALNDVRLKRGSRGYTFAFTGKGGFSFDDDAGTGANGSVKLTGRFSTTAKSARGTVRVTLKRCGTRTLHWAARRAG